MRVFSIWLAVCVGSAACAAKTTPTADAASTADTAQSETAASDSTPAGDGTAASCPIAKVNDKGVGKPCKQASDCFGQLAVTCWTDVEANVPAMCVQYCFGVPGECGDKSVCVQRGAKAAVCVPVQCAPTYSMILPNDVTCTQPCADSVANDLGVGKVCKTHDDCKGQVAKTCPSAIQASNPNWCSLLCTEDKDCGKDAICWRRESEEFGVKFKIGSCAVNKCCKSTK